MRPVHEPQLLASGPIALPAVSVEAPGTPAALDFLARRFAAPGSSGVREVVRCVADAAAVAAGGAPLMGCAGHSSEEHQQQYVEWLHLAAGLEAGELCGQLASLPERTAHLLGVPAALAPAAFAAHALREALAAATECLAAAAAASECHISSGGDGGPSCEEQRLQSHGGASTSAPAPPAAQPQPAPSAAAAAAPGAAQVAAADAATGFVALLAARLLARGQARVVAAELVRALGAGGPEEGSEEAGEWAARAVRAAMVQLAGEQGALARLLPELLLRLGVQAERAQAATSSSGGSGEAPPLLVLRQLLQPLLAQPQAVHLLTDKLLLQRTLPEPALALLLSFLGSCTPLLLLPAAARLAGTWSDSHTITGVRLPQQAYMTAALLGCLAALPPGSLDPVRGGSSSRGGGADAAALLPALLQGVSARLSSPLPAVRLQAMRVGRALSVALDPSAASPLFEDQGDLGLLREELWPGAAPRAQRQQPNRPASGARSTSGAQEPPPAAARPGSALARLHEADAAVDSDDEEAHAPAAAAAAAVPAAGGHGDDDDGGASEADSLEAYDLEEDLEAEAWEGGGGGGRQEDTTAAGGTGGVRGSAPLALAPLVAALRKTDDVEAVLDALKRVSWEGARGWRGMVDTAGAVPPWPCPSRQHANALPPCHDAHTHPN